jgi:hypothetical protein
MDETREPEKAAEGQLDIPVRRPWHAPQFLVTDFTATNVMCNGGTDHGPMNSSS